MTAGTKVRRWQATAVYRTSAGSLDVTHDIEELDELQNLIERGPDWNALERITIVLARRSEPETFTVEDGEQK